MTMTNPPVRRSFLSHLSSAGALLLSASMMLVACGGGDDDTLVLADGFSCRSQISSGSDRSGLHLAQVLAMAIREGQDGRRTR